MVRCGRRNLAFVRSSTAANTERRAVSMTIINSESFISVKNDITALPGRGSMWFLHRLSTMRTCDPRCPFCSLKME